MQILTNCLTSSLFRESCSVYVIKHTLGVKEPVQNLQNKWYLVSFCYLTSSDSLARKHERIDTAQNKKGAVYLRLSVTFQRTKRGLLSSTGH